MTAQLEQAAREPGDVATVLTAHDGNASAAITALIEEIRRLHRELALAEFASSRGFARGWRPEFERLSLPAADG